MTELTPWATCPKCRADGYHLFGQRYDDGTGERVESLEVVGEIPIRQYAIDEPSDFTPLPTAVVDRELVADLVERECRQCGHVWPQEIDRRVVRNWQPRCTCLRRIRGVSITTPQRPLCPVHGC